MNNYEEKWLIINDAIFSRALPLLYAGTLLIQIEPWLSPTTCACCWRAEAHHGEEEELYYQSSRIPSAYMSPKPSNALGCISAVLPLHSCRITTIRSSLTWSTPDWKHFKLDLETKPPLFWATNSGLHKRQFWLNLKDWFSHCYHSTWQSLIQPVLWHDALQAQVFYLAVKAPHWTPSGGIYYVQLWLFPVVLVLLSWYSCFD